MDVNISKPGCHRPVPKTVGPGFDKPAIRSSHLCLHLGCGENDWQGGPHTVPKHRYAAFGTGIVDLAPLPRGGAKRPTFATGTLPRRARLNTE